MTTNKHYPFSLLFLLFTSSVFAQFENNLKLRLDFQPIELELSPILDFNIGELELTKPLVFNKANDTLNVFPDIDLESRQYIKELGLYKRQLVRTFVTLGGYEWVNAEKTHDFWDNTKVTYGLGLLKSYTYVDPTSTQYQITANLEIEQPINSWLTASGKAMYVSNPIYKFNKSNGTLFKGNPLFMQNEAEINLNAHYNNVMVDIGLRSIFNGFSGGGKNLNLINTRMTIGF
nr:hypothetical protein [uncultured Carboxylicivirga sp.]